MSSKKIFLIIVGLFILLAVFLFWSIQRASANEIEKKAIICHCESVDSESPFQCQTLEIGVKAAKKHLEEHEADYKGECKVEPTPTPTPTATPTPEITPEVTPTPEETLEVRTSVAGAPELPQCEAPTWAPTVTEVGRVDSDTVFARWTKVSDNVDTYVVWYGTSENNLSWNTEVHGEYVELSGEELVNTHVWLKVAGEDNACIGPYSVVTDP